jgi:DeoR/GlpR family transcriptional regulator of sugar metabolism
MNPQESTSASSPRTMTDVMNLPEEQRQLINWIIRQQKVSLSEAATHLNLSEELAQQALDLLLFQGFIQEFNDHGSVYYQPQLANQKKSKLAQDIWSKLET